MCIGVGIGVGVGVGVVVVIGVSVVAGESSFDFGSMRTEMFE